MKEKNVSKEQIELFLREVDTSFPTPLSKKHNLSDYAWKLFEKATLCMEIQDGRIFSVAAGYTENVIENRGYLSMVATADGYQGRGYAKKLVKQFLEAASDAQLDAVHLYAVSTNTKAVSMYEKLGFEEWKLSDEPRPDDLHLIYYLSIIETGETGRAPSLLFIFYFHRSEEYLKSL